MFRSRRLKLSLLAFGALIFGAATCKPIPEDQSAFASEAGQSTIVLGACDSEFNLGWGHCSLTRGSTSFPTLNFVMTAPGEWAVGDCELGLYKSGAAAAPGIVEVDLSGLKDQAEKNGFCVLKIETVEHFPDPHDGSVLRSVPMHGGFFVEMVQPGYMPVPDPKMIAFCLKVSRTTKGRTVIEKCKP